MSAGPPRSAQRRAARTARGQPGSLLAYSVFWVAWVLAGVGVEIAAVVTRTPGAPLSNHVWDWITMRNDAGTVPKSARWCARILILGFFAWLGPHLAWHIW